MSESETGTGSGWTAGRVLKWMAIIIGTPAALIIGFIVLASLNGWQKGHEVQWMGTLALAALWYLGSVIIKKLEQIVALLEAIKAHGKSS